MVSSQSPQYLSCKEARKVDRYAIDELGIEGLLLMENAARGCVDLLEDQIIKGPVWVVCGKGNNGGDGFAIVRHLQVRNVPSKAILIGDPINLKGDALTNYEYLCSIDPELVIAITDPELDQERITRLLATFHGEPTEWIVDALLGTGTTGIVQSPFAEVISAINHIHAKVLSVDIPSGLNADSGKALGPTIRADVTATFVGLKLGFQADEAQQYLGQIHVLDIGIPASVVAAAIRS